MEISEEILESIKSTPKTMQARSSITQKSSKQWGFDIEFENSGFLKTNDSELLLNIFARQNTLDSENFSCGIQVKLDNKKTILSRYNGSNHKNDVANYECHIHHATPESINRGDRNPEHEDTRVTDRYTDLNGALRCLFEDYNIKVQGQQQGNLFGEILL